MPAIRIWQTIPLNAPRHRLHPAHPRSTACSISTAQDYYPNVWSNSSSGIGSASTPALCNNRSCPASALRFAVWSNSSSGIASNTASGAASSCPIFISSGGERAGAIAGAMVGSPTYSRICRTVASSVMNPTRRTRPPHPLHLSANTPQIRPSNCAHKNRAGCPVRVPPKSARTVFGRGALLPAPGFRPACAPRNASPCRPGTTTPPSMYKCKCACAFTFVDGYFLGKVGFARLHTACRRLALLAMRPRRLIRLDHPIH